MPPWVVYSPVRSTTATEPIQKLSPTSDNRGYWIYAQNGTAEAFGDAVGRTPGPQMALLRPRLAILDETDSGLDIDALKLVAEGVNRMRHSERAIVLVTHYQRLLNFVQPDFVHVLSGGRIVKSGGKELALELEEKGYGWLEEGKVAAR